MSVIRTEAYRDYPLGAHACRCGCEVMRLSARLILAYRALEYFAEDAIIEVLSGYRCERHNVAVGGSPRSRHLIGQALDGRVHGLTIADQYAMACEVRAWRDGGIGIYLDWAGGPGLHADVRPYEVRWAELDGKLYPGEAGIRRALDVAAERGM